MMACGRYKKHSLFKGIFYRQYTIHYKIAKPSPGHSAQIFFVMELYEFATTTHQLIRYSIVRYRKLELI